MKKMLSQANKLYHIKNDVMIDGVNELLTGDCTGLRGNCTGLRGNCYGLTGDIDDCELSEKERKLGIDISELIDK